MVRRTRLKRRGWFRGRRVLYCPPMNRTDRLLAIVLELQAHGARRAEDLAASFEVSKRTIYRDVQALCEAGVPVVAEPGRGYSLPAGYFLPPLRFSADEAVMLLLGADLMARSFDADYRRAAEDAARKIAGALPAERREAVADLRAGLLFTGPGNLSPAGDEILRGLRGAIVGRRRVSFGYRARYGADGPAEQARTVDPYGLAQVGGVWYLVGHCHLRGDVRNFRLDRMAGLALRDETFVRPADFRLGVLRDERPLRVVARFDPAVADWVRESPSFYATELSDGPGGLTVTFRVRRLDELLPWLLSWGGQAEAIEPPELRDMLAAAAAAILRRNGAGC